MSSELTATSAIAPAVTNAAMRAARNFAGVIAQSVAQAEEVTLPQLRVLVLAQRHHGLNNSAVAAALKVHLSNATRICDRLVHAGLLHRQESKADRRRVELTLTTAGSQLVETVMDHRRAALIQILEALPAETHPTLANALDLFSDAAEAVLPEAPPAL